MDAFATGVTTPNETSHRIAGREGILYSHVTTLSHCSSAGTNSPPDTQPSNLTCVGNVVRATTLAHLSPDTPSKSKPFDSCEGGRRRAHQCRHPSASVGDTNEKAVPTRSPHRAKQPILGCSFQGGIEDNNDNICGRTAIMADMNFRLRRRSRGACRLGLPPLSDSSPESGSLAHPLCAWRFRDATAASSVRSHQRGKRPCSP